MPRQVDLDMIELIDNKLTVDEYLKLRALVGWKKLLAWDVWWEMVQSSATCRIL